MAILEPFIDTTIICFLTGLVLLSSGVWNEKLPNQFQKTDIEVLAGSYDNRNAADVKLLEGHLSNSSRLALFNGKLTIEEGDIAEPVSILHARSLAEDVKVFKNGVPYSGEMMIEKGRVTQTESDISFSGNSLVHSAPLTTAAFTRSFLGDYGKYIVAIGLLLFAFSTAIAWSYYGDRAVTYLVGARYVMLYRIIFVAGFFVASFTDTTIIWNLSLLTVTFMAVPNLIGLLLLHREVKGSIRDYWSGFRDEHPLKGR